MLVGRSVRMKDINAIHQAIDVPTAFDKQLKEEMGLGDNFMDLQKGGGLHRNYNHDPYIGLAKAMKINPQHGFEIYMSHLLMDRLSNMIRDSVGTDNRDIQEIILNRYLKSVNQNLPRTYVNRKNPFFKSPIEKPDPLKKLRRKNRFYRMRKDRKESLW